MSWLAHIALISVIPGTLLLFSLLPPRRAVIITVVVSWLFLPGTGYSITGLPEYTKSSSSALAIFLGIFLYDAGRLFSFRPRWYDIFMVSFCAGGFITSIVNDLGVYDGVSVFVNYLSVWGIPYFFGRLYLTTLDDLAEFALAMVIGGLLYLPLCVFEMRFSPVLNRLVYAPYDFGYMHLPRYGLGYRPVVFLQNGMETAMVMCASAIVAYWLWATGAQKEIKGVKMGWIALALIVITFLTTSMGAITMLIVGIMTLILTKRTRLALFVLLLGITPFTYVSVRIPKIWSGKALVDIFQTTGEDRAGSLAFRLYNEDLLIDKAIQRPIFGWGNYGRARVYTKEGRQLGITDGLWIIFFGNQGFVGLFGFFCTMVVPTFLLVKNCPTKRWMEPRIAPAFCITVALLLWTLDNLSNASSSTIFLMASGGVMGLGKKAFARTLTNADQAFLSATLLEESGHPADAEIAYGLAIREYSKRAIEKPDDLHARQALAETQTALGTLLMNAGHVHEAEDALIFSARLWGELGSKNLADVSIAENYAQALERLGRLYKSQGREPELLKTWTKALEVWSHLTKAAPDNSYYVKMLADGQNNLAWALATVAGAGPEERARAITYASKAVEANASNPAYWNTLGSTQLLAGKHEDAIASLNRAIELSDSVTAFDLLPITVALAQNEEYDRARESYFRGIEWMDANNPDHPDLLRFRAWADSLLSAHSLAQTHGLSDQT